MEVVFVDTLLHNLLSTSLGRIRDQKVWLAQLAQDLERVEGPRNGLRADPEHAIAIEQEVIIRLGQLVKLGVFRHYY
jgi:hypothetical protein